METQPATPIPAIVPVKKEPTITERLMADSPKFFKIVEIIGYIFLVAAGVLTEAHILLPTSPIVLAGGSIAATMIAVSKFAVKDVKSIQGPVTIDAIADLLPRLLDQYKDVKSTTEKPFVPEPLSDTIDALKKAAAPEVIITDQQTVKGIIPEGAITDLASAKEQQALAGVATTVVNSGSEGHPFSYPQQGQ